MKKSNAITCLGFITLALLLSSSPSQAAKRSTTPAAPKETNDFSTQARVEYVLQCMDEHGGQNLNNLYHCVCAVDTIANKMKYDEFVEAQTFTQSFNLAGERGGEFRDPPRSAKLRDQFKEALTTANEKCFPETGK
jgi:hypothetical protein